MRNEINSFHSINQIQKVRSEKMMDHVVPQTKHTKEPVVRFRRLTTYIYFPVTATARANSKRDPGEVPARRPLRPCIRQGVSTFSCQGYLYRGKNAHCLRTWPLSLFRTPHVVDPAQLCLRTLRQGQTSRPVAGPLVSVPCIV